MPASLRFTTLAVGLSLSGLLGRSEPLARAQGYRPAPVRYYLPPVYCPPAPASSRVPGASYPAPAYRYPAPTLYYYPRHPHFGSRPYVQTQPHSFRTFDENGVEHDPRYPHWSFDYNDWVAKNIK